MSLPRRRRLVEVAHERELLVLEDNPYGLLRYEGEPPPPLLSLDGGVYVMYLGTFSKILSPGIRLGWVVAPPPVLEKINLGKQAADLCTSTLSQLMVQAYFAEGRWRDYVESLTEIYRARRDTMLDALADQFPPQADWTRPSGGLFIWATLPDFIDTTDLLARALRENVAFVPGEAAFLDGRGRNAMRLNFSGSDEDAIREGIRRIGEVVTEQVQLYGTLTGEIQAVELRRDRGGGAAPGRRRHPSAAGPRRAGAARRRLILFFAVREVLGRDVVEEVLELLDDLLRVLHLVLELDGGLGDHVLGGEDRRAGADREGERVGGARVDRDLAAVQLERDLGVEGVVAQLGDGDARAATSSSTASPRSGRGSSAAACSPPGASSGSPPPPGGRSRSGGTCCRRGSSEARSAACRPCRS